MSLSSRALGCLAGRSVKNESICVAAVMCDSLPVRGEALVCRRAFMYRRLSVHSLDLSVARSDLMSVKLLPPHLPAALLFLILIVLCSGLTMSPELLRRPCDTDLTVATAGVYSQGYIMRFCLKTCYINLNVRY